MLKIQKQLSDIKSVIARINCIYLDASQKYFSALAVLPDAAEAREVEEVLTATKQEFDTRSSEISKTMRAKFQNSFEELEIAFAEVMTEASNVNEAELSNFNKIIEILSEPQLVGLLKKIDQKMQGLVDTNNNEMVESCIKDVSSVLQYTKSHVGREQKEEWLQQNLMAHCVIIQLLNNYIKDNVVYNELSRVIIQNADPDVRESGIYGSFKYFLGSVLIEKQIIQSKLLHLLVYVINKQDNVAIEQKHSQLNEVFYFAIKSNMTDITSVIQAYCNKSEDERQLYLDISPKALYELLFDKKAVEFLDKTSAKECREFVQSILRLDCMQSDDPEASGLLQMVFATTPYYEDALKDYLFGQYVKQKLVPRGGGGSNSSEITPSTIWNKEVAKILEGETSIAKLTQALCNMYSCNMNNKFYDHDRIISKWRALYQKPENKDFIKIMALVAFIHKGLNIDSMKHFLIHVKQDVVGLNQEDPIAPI